MRSTLGRWGVHSVSRSLINLGRVAGALVIIAAVCAVCIAQADASALQVIYTFQGAPQDGNLPLSKLAVDALGRLYGTTAHGGASGGIGLSGIGTVFRLTAGALPKDPWTEEILYSFPTDGLEGADPGAGVTLDSAGSIYGTTEIGGPSAAQNGGFGVVFKITNSPGLPYSVLHAFTRGEGGAPDESLLFGPDGLLHGVTGAVNYSKYVQSGGAAFELSPLSGSGDYADLYKFGANGQPYSPSSLVLLSTQPDTVYLGALQFGGPDKRGGVFTLMVNPTREQLIYGFVGGLDVGQPSDPPVIGRGSLAGSYYGCATTGGAYGQGGIFQITPHQGAAATETVLYNFGAQPNDPKPVAIDTPARCSLLQGQNSNTLYGVSTEGGLYNGGAFFEVNPPASGQAGWTEKVDVSFGGSSPIAEPDAAPIEIKGQFYGTAVYGLYSDGAVYKITP
jgi:hypothetical protein